MRYANVTGKFQLPPELRHGWETLPHLTLTLTLCQKHVAVQFSGNADALNNSTHNKNNLSQKPRDVVINFARSLKVVKGHSKLHR